MNELFVLSSGLKGHHKSAQGTASRRMPQSAALGDGFQEDKALLRATLGFHAVPPLTGLDRLFGSQPRAALRSALGYCVMALQAINRMIAARSTASIIVNLDGHTWHRRGDTINRKPSEGC